MGNQADDKGENNGNFFNDIVITERVALFLFGMSLMGDGLKMVAGNKLEAFLYRMTNTPLKGVALGTAVTSGSSHLPQRP